MASADILSLDNENFHDRRNDDVQYDYPDSMETYGLHDDINDVKDEDDDYDSDGSDMEHYLPIPHDYDDIITPRHHIHTPDFRDRNVDDIVDKYLGPLGGEHLRRHSPTCDCCESINEINFEQWKRRHTPETRPILRLPRITGSATTTRVRKQRPRRTVSFNDYVERTEYTPEPPMRELFSETQILPSHEVIMDSRQIMEPESTSTFLPNYFTDSAGSFADEKDKDDDDDPPKSTFIRSSSFPSFAGTHYKPGSTANIPGSKPVFDSLVVDSIKPTFNRSSSLPGFPQTPVQVKRGYDGQTRKPTESKLAYKPLTLPIPLTPDARPMLLPELKMAPTTPPEVTVSRDASVADNVVKASSRYDDAMEKLGQKLQTAFS